jgi:glucose-6-phosphate 1-dehydrogenase
VIVLFGATCDLAQRKLLPGMFHLTGAGLMPERFRVMGTSRRELAGVLAEADKRDAFRARRRVVPSLAGTLGG